MEELSLNNVEIMLVYMAIGHMYTDMKDFLDAEEYDELDEDQQIYSLSTYESTFKLYERLTKYLESNKVPVSSVFNEDTAPRTPIKGI